MSNRISKKVKTHSENFLKSSMCFASTKSNKLLVPQKSILVCGENK